MDIKIEVGDIDLSTVIGATRLQDPDGEYGEYTDEPVTLADEVISSAVKQLTKTDEYRGLQQRIRDVRTEVIREQVEKIVCAAIENPVQQTDTWGEPKGQPVSLRELIVQEAKDYLKRSTDSYGSRQTILQKQLAEAVGRAWKDELASVVAEEKAKVEAVVRAKAADLIAQSITAGVGGK